MYLKWPLKVGSTQNFIFPFPLRFLFLSWGGGLACLCCGPHRLCPPNRPRLSSPAPGCAFCTSGHRLPPSATYCGASRLCLSIPSAQKQAETGCAARSGTTASSPRWPWPQAGMCLSKAGGGEDLADPTPHTAAPHPPHPLSQRRCAHDTEGVCTVLLGDPILVRRLMLNRQPVDGPWQFSEGIER